MRAELKFLVTIALFALCLSTYASDLLVRGQVKGLNSPARKAVPIVLSDVSVSAVAEGADRVNKTNLAGVFTLELKRDKRYLITISRKGYHSKSIWINTHKMPKLPNNKHVELTDLDFLLMKKRSFPDDISSKEDMGQLFYDSKKNEFQLSVNGDYRQGKEARDHSLRLLRKTITYTGEDIDKVEKKTPKELKVKKENDPKSFVEQVEARMPAIESEMLETITTMRESDDFSETSLEKQRTRIDSARAELEYLREHATTKEDSLNLQKLEAQLRLLEMDLDYAEEIIGHQNEKISMQSTIITFIVISALLLLAVLGVVYWFYRDKARTNRELAEKNQLIMDGINYANTIQKSFLKKKEDIEKIIPGFSMLFRPRDVVSGDFYWMSEVGGKKVIAAIDCTGHGVPGAFISMIGNTLLNEIVNNKKILDPGKILEDLHDGVKVVLQQDGEGRHSQDGMDMSLIVVDEAQKNIKFAGAKNHLYRVKGDEVDVVKANIESVGGRALRAKDGFKKTFTTKEVVYDSDSAYFMCSDGYMDQFGGGEDKKFNLTNFMELIKKCAKLPAEKQNELMKETFESWMGSEEQLDDVLVLGVKFS